MASFEDDKKTALHDCSEKDLDLIKEKYFDLDLKNSLSKLGISEELRTSLSKMDNLSQSEGLIIFCEDSTQILGRSLSGRPSEATSQIIKPTEEKEAIDHFLDALEVNEETVVKTTPKRHGIESRTERKLRSLMKQLTGKKDFNPKTVTQTLETIELEQKSVQRKFGKLITGLVQASYERGLDLNDFAQRLAEIDPKTGQTKFNKLSENLSPQQKKEIREYFTSNYGLNI